MSQGLKAPFLSGRGGPRLKSWLTLGGKSNGKDKGKRQGQPPGQGKMRGSLHCAALRSR